LGVKAGPSGAEESGAGETGVLVFVQPMLERFFGLAQNQTKVRTEVAAGVTTFLTMAYIIFVQPAVLSGKMFGVETGMDFGAVMTATCLAAALATTLMALLARYPIAQAPAHRIHSRIPDADRNSPDLFHRGWAGAGFHQLPGHQARQRTRARGGRVDLRVGRGVDRLLWLGAEQTLAGDSGGNKGWRIGGILPDGPEHSGDPHR